MDTINGKDISSYGVTLLSGCYSALLAPPPLKTFLENKDRSKDGTEVLVHNCKIAEREVTLTFLIQGASRAEFLNHYQSFISLLHAGWFILYIGDLNQTYRLLYDSSTQFDNYNLTSCKISVKFREPNPANRSNEA